MSNGDARKETWPTRESQIPKMGTSRKFSGLLTFLSLQLCTNTSTEKEQMKRERDAFQRNNQKIMHKTTITEYNHLTLFIIIFRAYKLPSFLVLFVSTASNKLKLPPTISRFNITRTILLFCLAHSPFALVFLAGPKRCRPIRKYLDRLTTNESPPFLQATKVSGYTVRQTPREGAKTVHCLRFFHCVTLRIPRTCSGFFAQFSAFSYCIK